MVCFHYILKIIEQKVLLIVFWTDTLIQEHLLYHFTEKEAAIEVRLVNGTTPHDGHVQVKTSLNGSWSMMAICSQKWTLKNAWVVCHMLNYTKAVSASTVNGSGPVYPNIIKCNGDESSIEQCTQIPASCNYSEVAFVGCGNLTKGKI